MEVMVIDKGKALLFLGMFLGMFMLVVLAVLIDLWDGVYTARRCGQRVHSHRLRVTADKICEYGRFVAIGFLVDCVGTLFSFYFLPFLAMLFGVGLMAVEIKSMFEHARRRKSRATDLGRILRSIVECAHEKDARKILAELLADGPAGDEKKETEPKKI